MKSRITTVFTLIITVFSGTAIAFPFENSHQAYVDDVRIHYRYWPVAEEELKGSFLLVHGFAGSTFSWQEVADSLQNLGYAVVAVDLPPFGFSDKSSRINRSMTAHAERLHQLIHTSFPGRTWHLAGHSMGGAVVQAYALMYPEDLNSVTFVAGALFSRISEGGQHVNVLLRLSPLRFVLGELAEQWFITGNRVEQLLESAYGKPPTEEQVNAYLQPLRIPGTARAILSSAAYNREIRSLEANALEVPAIAIWGKEDTWVNYRGRKPVLEQMQNLQLVLMEDTGHNPMETHFDEFMEAWLAALQGMYYTQ